MLQSARIQIPGYYEGAECEEEFASPVMNNVESNKTCCLTRRANLPFEDVFYPTRQKIDYDIALTEVGWTGSLLRNRGGNRLVIRPNLRRPKIIRDQDRLIEISERARSSPQERAGANRSVRHPDANTAASGGFSERHCLKQTARCKGARLLHG